MATVLPPTVHERLARCGERGFVYGLVLGATVELHAEGTVFTGTTSSGSCTFTVSPHAPGAVVRARQDASAGFTTFSPFVVVENASVPPKVAPSLPDVEGLCSRCAFVTHAPPGARLELRIGGKLVGESVANHHGDSCVRVDLRDCNGEPGATLTAYQVACGAPGSDTTGAQALHPAD